MVVGGRAGKPLHNDITSARHLPLSLVLQHPIDLINASTGALVGQLADPNLTTICPVNKPHPRLDLIGVRRAPDASRPRARLRHTVCRCPLSTPHADLFLHCIQSPAAAEACSPGAPWQKAMAQRAGGRARGSGGAAVTARAPAAARMRRIWPG